MAACFLSALQRMSIFYNTNPLVSINPMVKKDSAIDIFITTHVGKKRAFRKKNYTINIRYTYYIYYSI